MSELPAGVVSESRTPMIPPLQWERVCSDCWQGLNPTEYLPEGSVDFGTCHVCLTQGTLHGMRTRAVIEALKVTGFRPDSMDPLSALEYEGGAEGLQALIDSGQWGLEGSVGRAMFRAIENGDAVLGLTPTRDYWGNRIPSRFEVKQGTKGSVAYMLEAQED